MSEQERDGRLQRMMERISEQIAECPDQFRAMWQELGSIVRVLLSDRRSMIGFDRRLLDTDKLVEQHDRAIFGDKNDQEAHPGMTLQIAEMKKTSEGNRKRLDRIFWILVGGLVSFVSKFGYDLLRTHFKI